MDDWHRKLARELVQGTPTGTLPDAAVAAAAALEIAFGHARSAITYVLELARAHRIPATGNVSGDDLWLQLGEGRVRFTLNRRETHVVVLRPGQPEKHVALGDGDLGAMAREALDALVAAWRTGPAHHRTPSAPPPDFEDEPTKG
jgi:hypothetical protein